MKLKLMANKPWIRKVWDSDQTGTPLISVIPSLHAIWGFSVSGIRILSVVLNKLSIRYPDSSHSCGLKATALTSPRLSLRIWDEGTPAQCRAVVSVSPVKSLSTTDMKEKGSMNCWFLSLHQNTSKSRFCGGHIRRSCGQEVELPQSLDISRW